MDRGSSAGVLLTLPYTAAPACLVSAMKSLAILLLALPAIAVAAPNVCTERGNFASLVAVARSKGLDERSVTEAAATDPNASFVVRLSHIEIIQTMYRGSAKALSPPEAEASARRTCEKALAKGR